jgi:rhamnosyltransferase
VRWNRGYDFGAWRDALKLLGREEVSSYDEIIFANNSCYGPLYPLEAMLHEAADDVDLWGITGFPASADSPRPEALNLPKRFIPEHIQSYFFVARRELVASNTFWDFWQNVPDHETLIDVVSYQEIQMTAKFAKMGYKYQILVPESLELQIAKASEPRYNAAYNSPFAMLVSGSAFVKKKAVGYSPEEADMTALLLEKLKLLPFLIFDLNKRS